MICEAHPGCKVEYDSIHGCPVCTALKKDTEIEDEVREACERLIDALNLLRGSQ